jgi:hypothetical protein
MKKSPENCVAMGEVWSTNLSPDFSTEIEKIGSSHIKNICTIISGLMCAGLSPPLPEYTRIVKQAQEVTTDPDLRIFLFSILTKINDNSAGQRTNISICSDDLKLGISTSWSSSSLLRQWIAVWTHSYMARFDIQPCVCQASNINVYAVLLLYENRPYTRAAAVSILTDLLYPDELAYNTAIVQLAAKALIDGSKLVRETYLHCICLFLSLLKEGVIDNVPVGEPEGIEHYLRKDMCSPVNYDLGLSSVLAIVDAFTEDPCQDIREIAESLLELPDGSMGDFVEQGVAIHRMAHMALFTRSQKERKIERYTEQLFAVDEVERFEILEVSQSRISALTLDFDHGNICGGTEDGTVFWGGTQWHPSASKICGVVPIDSLHVLAAAIDGSLYIFRNGCSQHVDCFRSCLKKPSGDVLMVTYGDYLFLAQGQDEILVWDIRALLLVDVIRMDRVVSKLARVRDKLFSGMNDGTILQIDLDSSNYEVSQVFTCCCGKRILRLGEHDGRLYCVLEDGRVYFWQEVGDACSTDICCDCLPFFELLFDGKWSYGVRLKENCMELIDIESGRVKEMRIDGSRPSCCYVDWKWPCCIVGLENGCVEVWRILK